MEIQHPRGKGCSHKKVIYHVPLENPNYNDHNSNTQIIKINIMTPPTSVLSTIIKTRASIPFLRKAARTALKVDVNRHCVAFGNTNAQYYLKETPFELAAMKDRSDRMTAAFSDCVDASTSSVVISWPDDGSPATASQHSDILQTLDSVLRETYPDFTTTKPFFMLDGGGRRMASLALLSSGSPDSRMVVPNNDSDYDGDSNESPGMWLRHYCSRRTTSATSQ